MRTTQVLRSLGPIDVANVRRDALLRWMLVMPLLIALLIRWGAPVAAEWLEGFGICLSDYNVLIASCLVLIAPMLYGVVVGFLLLDQKDDQTLMALRVTPLTAGGYLAYRITIPLVLSVVITPVMLTLSGLSEIGLARQLLAGVAAAPFAPAFALFLAAFARNKVQGFALMKAAGIITWPSVIAWFVTSKWQLAFGLCPTYWPVKFYWALEAGSPGAWIHFVVGIVYMSLLVSLLLRRFDRSLTR